MIEKLAEQIKQTTALTLYVATLPIEGKQYLVWIEDEFWICIFDVSSSKFIEVEEKSCFLLNQTGLKFWELPEKL